MDERRDERGLRFDDAAVLDFLCLVVGVRSGTELLRRVDRAGVGACKSSSCTSDLRPRRRFGDERSGASDKRRFLFGPSSSPIIDLTSSSDPSEDSACCRATSLVFFGLGLPASNDELRTQCAMDATHEEVQ